MKGLLINIKNWIECLKISWGRMCNRKGGILLMWSLAAFIVILEHAADIDGWFAKIFNNELAWCYEHVQSSLSLKGVVLLLSLYGIIHWLFTRFKQLYGFWTGNSNTGTSIGDHMTSALAVCCMLLFVVKWPGEWVQYSILGWNLSFLWITIVSFVSAGVLELAFALSMFFKCCVNVWKELKQEENPEEISTEVPLRGLPIKSHSYYDDGRRRFAGTVSQMIVDTDLREEPVAIGITGDWGSGKSLVLEEVHKCLKESGMDVIEFFPWQSFSPSSLIEDFFKSLSSALHHHSRKLGYRLENYAGKLIELDLDKRLNFIAKICRTVSGEYVSINSAREKIETELASLPRSVAVIIDDLDRLDADEMFETLRLIRNTAHFKNLAYIVAYDKNYVAKALESKGIAQPEKYLDKIFAFNMPLPATEHYTYGGVIFNQMQRKYGRNSSDFRFWYPLLFEYYPNKPNFLLNVLISNYRQAVSLASFLVARMELLKKGIPDYNVNIIGRDWYYLQLICFFYPSLYRRLETQPESVLEPIKAMNGETMLGYSEEKVKRLNEILPENEKITDGADLLLKKLFHYNRVGRQSAQSIVYVRNIGNYFALRILNNEVAESDFIDFLQNQETNISVRLYEWSSHKPSLKDSLTGLFGRHSLTNMDAVSAARYVEALLKWWVFTEDERALHIISELTLASYNETAFSSAEVAYKTTVSQLVDDCHKDYHILCKAIISQTPLPYDPTDPEIDYPICFLTESEAKDLIGRIIRKAFINDDIFNVDDLSVKDSTVRRILESSYNYNNIDENIIIYNSYAIDTLIQCWTDLAAHAPNAKGHDLKSLLKEFVYDIVDDDAYSEEYAESIAEKRSALFQSDLNFRMIVEKLYDVPEEEKQSALQSISVHLPA